MHKQQHEKHKPAAQVRLSRTPLWKHMCGNRQAAANTQPEINKIKAKGEQKKPLRCQSYPRIRTHTHTHTQIHRHTQTQTQTHTDTDTHRHRHKPCPSCEWGGSRNADEMQSKGQTGILEHQDQQHSQAWHSAW